MTRNALPFYELDVHRLNISRAKSYYMTKFSKKTIDKFKILCYNLVTKLRQELNKIKIGCDLPQKEN